MAAEVLGDLGADVIKIEDGSGDLLRGLGGGPHPELSGMALNLLRNRRSITLDLSNQRDRTNLIDLVSEADVFVTNLRPKSLKNLGISYDDLRAYNSKLIYCQAAGYPSDSEAADEPAYDDVIQATAGIADAMGRLDEIPKLVPTIVADKISALIISNAITAALFHRERTGESQRVEVPMVDSVRWFLLQEHLADAATVPATGRPGYARMLTPNRRPHRTVDGWMAALPYSDRNWRDLFGEVGRPELSEDPRFTTVSARINNANDLYELLGQFISTRTTEEWIAAFARLNIPAGRVVTMDELVEQLPVVQHPIVGPYRLNTNPMRFDKTPTSLHRHAPLHGEHNGERWLAR